MKLQRILLWCLTAIASVFPVWWVYSSVVTVDLPVSDFILSLFMLVIPVVSMGVLMLWAVRVDARIQPSGKADPKSILLLAFLGYIGAFIVLNRSMCKGSSQHNANASA